ncbi:protein unc-13 homolog isoform X2 [Ricinus communis]|uniref:protein unc-13 homolog isoform X2 n=1 Tax=Ricinus communis TaxID=3988 RepID=UPI00201B0A38|nr:protein unc-13 homolog isoform X2 [Ricinus communis]
MEEQKQVALLHRYRRDRQKLLEFLLSSGLIRELRISTAPVNSLSDIDFDSLSTDYILHSLKSGGVIDVTEATNNYLLESAYPITSHSLVRDTYFLVSDPDIAGSPPRRVPPIPVHQTTNASQSSQVDCDCTKFANDCGLSFNVAANSPVRPSQTSEIPQLGLPSLSTGLSDDDLRESAYELLLASIFLPGVEGYSVDDRKREKNSKFLSGLKSKREKMPSHSQYLGRDSEFINTVRVQMQISEAMDACIRRNLMQLAARRMYGQIDLTHISLGLLNGVFKSDFRNEKSYMQWKNRQANILEEFLCFSAVGNSSKANVMTAEHLSIRSHVAKIRDEKEWDTIMSPSERVAVLASIRQFAVNMSSLPGKFRIEGETYYWTASYHLNIRLYEKLLFGVFDVLDEGQLVEEAGEVLSRIKSTWAALGITQKLHNALYGWVLFRQFVETDGGQLLEDAVLELQKFVSAEEADGKEEQYMNSLVCSRQCDQREVKLNLAQSICLSISIWCDSTLQDYHLHFSQKPSCFRTLMTLFSAVGVLTVDDHGEIKLTKLGASDDYVSGKLKSYVNKSTEAVYGRAAKKVDLEAKLQRVHPLALLAKELKLIAEREFNVFWPVLRQWCPESLMISIVLLHQFYGKRLKPFLKGVSSLSEDVRSVLPAAKMLDDYLTQLHITALEANRSCHSSNQTLDHYQIGEVSTPLILDWVISQHAHILEWTGRAFDIEDWEPLSFHQRQAASIVEVFRIVEETVDQFFGLNLPMDITHLQALLSVIFHSLDAYLLKMLNQLVEKKHLYPSAPPLTRYTETAIPVIKKRLLECALLDDSINRKLNELTIPKLCIRLNTFQYIQKQIGILEDGIRKSWAQVRSSHNQRCRKDEPLEEDSLLTHGEAIDALFSTTFSIIKDTATGAINKICAFTGARVVFWDLRDKFLFQLYRGDVESSRLESFLHHIDTVLDLICGLIDDTLRDLLVLSIFRTSLEAYVWVLLDGGPSRAFSDSDVALMEDDFNILKDFFIADGEGLPRSLVEQEAKFAQQILGIFSLQTETVVKMLMNASEHISVGSDSDKQGQRLDDAHTLVRVLCHKKDREASKFLKRQYQLPMSSEILHFWQHLCAHVDIRARKKNAVDTLEWREYDDTSDRDSTLKSPLISEFLKRSYSTHWTKQGQSSFKSIKKKLQEATSEIRNVAR